MKNGILASMAAIALAIGTPALAQKTAGNMVDDGTITTSVKAGLVGDKGLSANDVNVEVYKGVVLLSGFVKTQAEKESAAKVAKGVSGVASVRNEIAVHPATSTGTKLDDTLLVGKVKAALVDTKDVKARQINVEARGGIVQLGGFVSSTGMRDRAIAVAKGVEGVKRVDDAMFVKPE